MFEFIWDDMPERALRFLMIVIGIALSIFVGLPIIDWCFPGVIG